MSRPRRRRTVLEVLDLADEAARDAPDVMSALFDVSKVLDEHLPLSERTTVALMAVVRGVRNELPDLVAVDEPADRRLLETGREVARLLRNPETTIDHLDSVVDGARPSEFGTLLKLVHVWLQLDEKDGAVSEKVAEILTLITSGTTVEPRWSTGEPIKPDAPSPAPPRALEP